LATVEDPAALSAEKRNSRAEIAGQLVTVLATMAPVSADSLALVASTVSTVLTNKEDVSRDSQETLITTIDKFVNALDDLVADQGTTMRQEVVAGVLKNAINLLDTTVSQIEDAVPLDVERNPKLMDYDTDLDSPGLSGMGEEALDELSVNNNVRVQSKTAASASNTMNRMLKKQMELLSPMLLPGGEALTTEMDSAVLGLMKLDSNSKKKTPMPAGKGGSQITAPNLCQSLSESGRDCSQSVTLQSMATEVNLNYFIKDPPSGIPVALDSPTVTLSMFDEHGQIELYRTNEPFEIILKKGPSFISPEFTSVDPTTEFPKLPASRIAVDNSEVYQALLVTELAVPDEQSGVTFQLKPEDPQACPQYLVVVSLLKPPVISRAGGSFDFWSMLPPNTENCRQANAIWDPDEHGYLYTYFLDNKLLKEAKQRAVEALGERKLSPTELQMVFIGYRQLEPLELNQYGPSNPPPIPYSFRGQINITAKSRAFVSTCVSTDSENPTSWNSRGCDVGQLTTAKQTQCLCYHLSTFASGWLELPNTLDFDYLFANMDFTKNPTLYATEIALGVLFLLLFIWARRKDIKDIEKLGVTPLAENNPDDEYLYEVIVSTGMRRGAGTDSRVCFMLSGEHGETDARVLHDPHRKVLQRGNCDRFLLACPRPLGSLIYCRIWHDNSGKGDRASWYCNYIGVVDLQTRAKFHFIVERWLAVEEEDGQIDRLIAVSTREELMAFTHMFTTSITHDLAEDHLWVSVVARPASSRFTRVERVATCMLLLFLSMLTSCMFYRGEGAAKQPDLLTIGPFALSAQEVFVAFINNLITLIPSFIVTYIFRNSRLYTSHAKKLREAVEEHLDETIDVSHVPAVYYEAKTSETAAEEEGKAQNLAEKSTMQKRQRERSCPWQMRIFAWIFLIVSLGVAVAFTTFYGVSFGEAVCQKWLSSLFLSFFASVILTQPIKVVVLALFLSFACKNSERADDVEVMQEEDALIEGLGRRYQLQMDEEYMHSDYLMNTFKPRKLVILPPDPEELERARLYRLKQRRANDIIREIFFYVIFLILLLVITMSFRAPFGFSLKKHLEQSFFDDAFTEMNTVEDFYAWARTTLIPRLRAKRWYNRDPPLYMRGFLEDRTDRIIGYGLMRQLRVRPHSCNVYKMVTPVIKYCYATYDMFRQDEQAYGVGWIPFQGDDYRNNSMLEFQYSTASELDGVPYMGETNWYSGGGYSHMLRGTLEDMLKAIDFLESVHWIDFCTRAVIVQLTVYNPNINLFAIITVLIEKPGVGTLIPTYRIETANLFGTTGSQASALEIGFQVAYILALLCYLVKEIRNLYKQRCGYFREMWNYIEWFIIIGSFAAIAAYAYMIIATKEAVAEFSRTHGNIFMNFQFLAYWNEALTYLLAVICFFATLKLVRLFRFNQRVGLLGAVLRYAAHDLKYFMIVFMVIFMAFVLVFYLLYTDTLDGFRTFLSSVETSLQIILGKFDFTSMYERELILGPLMFAVFTLCIIFIVISMFLAILDESFHSVMQDIRLQSGDHEMTQFILSQLVVWTGLNRTDWGRRYVGSVTGPQEPSYSDDSERELSHKLKELNSMMDEFLCYVQMNYLADSEKYVKSSGPEESSVVLK
ncbi:PLAT/LH2 domain protein, partial [Opisthorchis viverrini]